MTVRPAFLRALAGETLATPPVWFMRQAGRYLPEYRAVRAEQPDFVSFCLNPEAAAEVTLQPMRRFPFSAAIVFADILLIPKALGQDVRFAAGEGPVLGPLPELSVMRERVGSAGRSLAAVGETLRRVRDALEPERALIGFAGAPWTVLTYMLDGRPGLDRAEARRFAYEEPEKVDALLEIVADATVDYLAMQAGSGADALKLFESWAEGLSDDLFRRLVITPHVRVLAGLRARGVDLPVIGFPRGADPHLQAYIEATPVQGLALGTSLPLATGRALQTLRPIQGALDPLLLRSGGPELDRRVDALLDAWGSGPYVFNLGHGILPDTPIAHVERVLERVTGERVRGVGSKDA